MPIGPTLANFPTNMPNVKLIIEDISLLLWYARKGQLKCTISKITHHWNPPLTRATMHALTAVQKTVKTPMPPPLLQLDFKTGKNECMWKPHSNPLSGFLKEEWTPSKVLPPSFLAVTLYSISLPQCQYYTSFDFVRMQTAQGPVLYGYYTMVWGTPRLGWDKAILWPEVAMAVQCPADFERVYERSASEVARCVWKDGDDMFREISPFCPIV